MSWVIARSSPIYGSLHCSSPSRGPAISAQKAEFLDRRDKLAAQQIVRRFQLRQRLSAQIAICESAARLRSVSMTLRHLATLI